MGFSNETIQLVWNKGAIVNNNDPNVWRKDECHAWIKRNEYGNRQSEYGWEVDHIKPESVGGGDALSNLRPLQWQNNASKQDGRLTCPITASGPHNK